MSASGMANGPWYVVPANIWAAIRKEHKKSGGEQCMRSCSALMKAKRELLTWRTSQDLLFELALWCFSLTCKLKCPIK